MDPYGDQAGVSFHSRAAAVVLDALKSLLDKRGGWVIKITRYAWQSASDGHSCGIWATWLAHKSMQYTIAYHAGQDQPDFENWASVDYPDPCALRSKYNEMY